MLRNILEARLCRQHLRKSSVTELFSFCQSSAFLTDMSPDITLEKVHTCKYLYTHYTEHEKFQT